MRFSAFIEDNVDAILDEWEAFVRTLLPAAGGLSKRDLRDHSRDMLLVIARDMETSQTEEERSAKSKHLAKTSTEPMTAAALHGAVRQRAGFELVQLVAEFRALRASVLKFWSRSPAAEAGQHGAEEIARFNESVDQMLAESVERYSGDVAKSRDMFLAVLGHDVRGPLSGIRMAADVLDMPELDAEKRRQVGLRIRRAAEVISQLTTDLLEYTRSRLGRGIPVETSPCDLREVCEEAIDTVQATHPDRHFEPQLSGDLRIDCDQARIQQVLSNLLNNALQYGDPALPVTLDVHGDEQRVTIKVGNFGEAIPANAMHSVFEPLFQLPRPSRKQKKPSQSSVGLGLFIVREIVQGHHGTVSVKSSTEAGTVFTVELPKAPTPLPAGTEAT